MFVSDAILLAGGLARDASNLAFIHRSDPLKPNEKKYIRINLEKLDTMRAFNENLRLEPFDRVEILSGLADADRVVVTGADKVTEGARVE